MSVELATNVAFQTPAEDIKYSLPTDPGELLQVCPTIQIPLRYSNALVTFMSSHNELPFTLLFRMVRINCKFILHVLVPLK